MKPTPQPPPVSLVEEWDNPAMTEFKRQEAEDRVTFALSHTQEEWRAALDQSLMRNEPIQLAPKRPRHFPFKPIKLPW
jgi:hypothetical protein